MRSITYVSAATHLFSESELWTLLEKCRVNNLKNDITGMLLYKDGNFIQTFEGPEDKVEQLYLKVCRDQCHCRIIKVFDEQIEERAFPTWSMGFSTAQDVNVPGYTNFLVRDINLDVFWERPDEAKYLLYHFKNTMR